MWWRLKETSVSALKLYSELPAWWKYFHKVMCIPSPLAHIFWVCALDTIDKNHIFCIFAESVAPHANTTTWRVHLNFTLRVWWWINHTDDKSEHILRSQPPFFSQTVFNYKNVEWDLILCIKISLDSEKRSVSMWQVVGG